MKKKDNIFIDIILFILVILATYYLFIMLEDFPIYFQLACEALSELFGNLAE